MNPQHTRGNTPAEPSEPAPSSVDTPPAPPPTATPPTVVPPAQATPTATTPTVVPLHAVGAGDLALAGGKGANLGELVRAGFPVPAGFVVTTEAFASVVHAAGLSIPPQPGGNDAAAIRARVAALALPDQLRQRIVEAHAELGGGPVAVRSSATAEDLPGAAFAGQQDTYLNVIGTDALIDAVHRCWASLWTDRAIAYRQRLGIDSAEVRIAVVVQRMAEAEIAGVMFTADPVSGDRERIVVDASGGLGEAVVSGLVSPDRYVLDGRGRTRHFTPGRHEVVITSAAGGGVRHETGDPRQARRLPDRVLTELARLGVRVAGHFGRPQDIEWAYANGRLWLLQARPMTALPPPPLRLNAVRRRLAAILLEYLPYRPYPIDVTTWLPFGPAGLMAKMTAHFGIRNTFEGFLREEDGVVTRLVPPTPRVTPGVLRAPVRLGLRAWRHDPARWTEDPRFTRFLEHVRDMAAEDLTAMPWHQLVRVPARTLALVAPIADLRIDYLPRSGLALLRLLVTLRLLGRSHLMGKLISSTPTRTADANHALAELAELVRSDPRLEAALRDLDPTGLAEFGDFRVRLAAFLAEYGHRECITPLLVTSPTWGESPQTVLGLIKALATAPPARADRSAATWAALVDHPLLRGHSARAWLWRWVTQARAGVAFREDSHFHFTRPLPILRRALLEIGARLRTAGVVAEPEEVFHLRLAEIEGISDPSELDERARRELRAAVRSRSARRAELSGVRLLDPGLVFPRTDTGDVLVAGTPASGGTARGPVRVINGPDEFGRLVAGDVLVCPYTNPSWTPLFQRAAAVVVDTGGLASHAAIVAREYGIPAVMGTATGTTSLVDGQVVTVDGDTGKVTDS